MLWSGRSSCVVRARLILRCCSRCLLIRLLRCPGAKLLLLDILLRTYRQRRARRLLMGRRRIYYRHLLSELCRRLLGSLMCTGA